MAKILLLIVGLFFSLVSLQSQNDKDFILTIRKDTLFGKVKFDTKTNVITFYYQKQKVIFHAATIDNFGMHRGGVTRVYKSISNDWEEDVFAEVMTEGKLNLYRYDTSGNKRYDSALDYGYRYYFGEANKSLMRMSPTSYKNILRMFLKKFPSLLAQRIAYTDVPKIIQTYNRLESRNTSK